MTIGVTTPSRNQPAPVSIQQAVSAGPAPLIFGTLDGVLANKQPFLQGGNVVAPAQADSTTGFVAPPVAGGLVAAGELLVTTATPLPVTDQQKRQNRQW